MKIRHTKREIGGDLVSEEQIKMKRCNKGTQCLTGDPLQPITNFSKRKASPDGHTYTCKTCEAAAARESYHRRKDKNKRAEYYQETREQRLEYHKEYYQKNKEKKAEYDKQYQQSKRGKKVMRTAQAKRRKALKEAGGEPYLRNDVIIRDSVDGVLYCQICKEPINNLADLQIDHIIPIVEGGRDELDNVRCAHKGCNLSRPKDGRDLKQEEECNEELDKADIPRES